MQRLFAWWLIWVFIAFNTAMIGSAKVGWSFPALIAPWAMVLAMTLVVTGGKKQLTGWTVLIWLITCLTSAYLWSDFFGHFASSWLAILMGVVSFVGVCLVLEGLARLSPGDWQEGGG